MKKSKISKILLLGASALLLTSITACGDDKSNQPAEESQDNHEEPISNSTKSSDVITDSTGYTEGATLTFNVTSANLDKAFVSYSSDNGTTWSKIDDELIRFDSSTNKARADILGLKAGSYMV